MTDMTKMSIKWRSDSRLALLALSLLLAACQTVPATNPVAGTQAPAPTQSPTGPIQTEPSPKPVSSAPVSVPDQIANPPAPVPSQSNPSALPTAELSLPAGLTAIRASLVTPLLTGRGHSSHVTVIGLDALGQPLKSVLPLSFSVSRPEAFSVTPDGLVTALLDSGKAELIVRVTGTALEARLSLGITAVGGSSSVSGSAGSEPVTPVNLPPVLSLSTSASSVSGMGRLVKLEASGSDPEGQSLSYSWSCQEAACGSFSTQAGATTYWRSPATSGTYHLTLSASDGSLNSQLIQPIAVTTGSSGLSFESGSRIWYVNAAATGGGGRSWSQAFNDLQTALAASQSGDEIRIAEGVYKPGGNRQDSFQLKSGVKVYGGFDAVSPANLPAGRSLSTDVTMLSGEIGDSSITTDNSHHVVTGASNTHLDGVTITAGNATDGTASEGGGIYLNTGSLSLSDIIVSSNLASSSGGGIYLINSTLTASRLTVTGNTAGNSGGGGLFAESSTVTLEDISFSANRTTAGGGGGIRLAFAVGSFNRGKFSDNYAQNIGGGGMIVSKSSATISNMVFENNVSRSYGGGLFVDRDPGTTTVSNSVFSRNQGRQGGGVANTAGVLTLSNSIIDRNTASHCGEGFFQASASSILTNVTFANHSGNFAICGGAGMANVLLWRSANLPDESALSAPITTDANGHQYDPKGNVLPEYNSDPFVDSAQPSGADGVWLTSDDGLRLKSTSIFLNIGYDSVPNHSVPLFDILGVARPSGAAPDPGAYEGGF